MSVRWQPTLLAAVLALAGHLLLSWTMVIPAAAVGGAMAERRAWLTGLLGVLLAWGLVVAYSFLAAPAETSEMARVMAGLAGDLPGFVIPFLTLLVGAVLGASGGWLGGATRRLVR